MRNKLIALIPARSGSKRIPNKNIVDFFGHPLMAYTIHQAFESGIFDSVVLATDSHEYARIGIKYGALIPELRSENISGSSSPDIEWVRWCLEKLPDISSNDYFMILRPTSPFRSAQTIIRAWEEFRKHPYADSSRAVEKCSQHPGKMWVKNGPLISPILPYKVHTTPWHSNQYDALPEIYVQNACIEVSKVKNVFEQNSISGDIIIPFETIEYEGLDINYEFDLRIASELVENKKVKLPKIEINNGRFN